MPTTPKPERGCLQCRPDLFPAQRLNALHYSWRLGVPAHVHTRWGVTLDHGRQFFCYDAYASTPGWVLRVVEDPSASGARPGVCAALLCSCSAGYPLVEKVWGDVWIVPI